MPILQDPPRTCTPNQAMPSTRRTMLASRATNLFAHPKMYKRLRNAMSTAPVLAAIRPGIVVAAMNVQSRLTLRIQAIKRERISEEAPLKLIVRERRRSAFFAMKLSN